MKNKFHDLRVTPPWEGKGGGFSFFRIAWREFRAIATNYAVLLVLVGGVFVYGLLYNYMYAPNVVREVPIAVVDYSCEQI